MIEQINSPTDIHIQIIENRDGNMERFLDRIHAVIIRFERNVFTCDGKTFKAKLIKKTDCTVVKSVVEKYEFMTNSYVTSSINTVRLEYIFTPMELDLSRSQFLGE